MDGHSPHRGVLPHACDQSRAGRQTARPRFDPPAGTRHRCLTGPVDARADPGRRRSAHRLVPAFASAMPCPANRLCASHVRRCPGEPRSSDRKRRFRLEDDAIPGDLLPHLPLAIRALPDDWEVLIARIATHRVVAQSRLVASGWCVTSARVISQSPCGPAPHSSASASRTSPRPVRFPLDHWRLWSLWHGMAVD